MYQLDAVEVQQPPQEVTRGDTKSALDVHEDDDSLTGLIHWECLSCHRPPPDLRLGPQQAAIH
jgi:hypothetical protein